MKQQRSAWPGELGRIDPSRLVYLDETGAKTNLTSTYARAPSSQRAVGQKPAGHYHNTTLISAIRQTGIAGSLAFDGACDTTAFCVYLDEVLLPNLNPGDVLVMDNLQVHKSAAVQRRLAEKEIQVLYLPPYSPDLNPIERMFSKLKNELRKIGARTREELFEAFGRALETITLSDLQNWIASALRTKT